MKESWPLLLRIINNIALSDLVDLLGLVSMIILDSLI